jgi:hypothetical protein
VWPHPVGKAGPVNPGHHTISCDETANIDFDIRLGVVYKFDYWGP